MQICANMLLKGIYTSSTEYDPKISLKQARAEGIKSVCENLAPMPREINFVVKKGQNWDDTYQFIRFPAKTIGSDPPFDSAQKSDLPQKDQRILNPRPIPNKPTKTRHISPDIKIPEKIEFAEIPEKLTVTFDPVSQIEEKKSENFTKIASKKTDILTPRHEKNTTTQHQKILKSSMVIGLTSNVQQLNSEKIIFGSGPILVILDINSLVQHCYPGAESDIMAVSSFDDKIIISACQNGDILFWNEEKIELLIKTSISASHVSIIDNFFIICGRSTKLGSSFTTVSVWEKTKKSTGKMKIEEICRGSTDQNVKSLSIDDSSNSMRFATGGQNGVRIWRLKNSNHLRSAPIDFGKHSVGEITSVDWVKNEVIASGRNGQIFHIDPARLKVIQGHQLIMDMTPSNVSALKSIEDKIVVGLADGNVRVWTDDLSGVKIEMSLKARVSEILEFFDENSCKCLIRTDAKSVGLLDLTSATYRTLFRTHATSVDLCAVSRSLLVTCSKFDLRVWLLRGLDVEHSSLIQVKGQNNVNFFEINIFKNIIQ